VVAWGTLSFKPPLTALIIMHKKVNRE
jgi:hypothetical protein